MTTFDEQWKPLGYGPCMIESHGSGWYQHLEDSDKVVLDVVLVQRQWKAGFPMLKRINLKGKVDTGSPYTIISRSSFQDAGFQIPSPVPTNLNVSGIVRKSQTEISDDEVLWGWRDVPIQAYPNTLFEKLGLPRCSLGLMVADNVADKKFLIGLDFLKHYLVFLNRSSLVVAAP